MNDFQSYGKAFCWVNRGLMEAPKVNERLKIMKHPTGRCKVIGHTEEELDDISDVFRIKLAEVLDALESSVGS